MPARLWIWSERLDLLWIAGGASLIFAATAVPVSFVWAGLGAALVAVLLHLGVLVNYPHYMATYELVVRERATRPRPFQWLIVTSPLMLGVVGAAVLWPARIVIPLVRVYLNWSAYHYASQHFGIASMYSAKRGRPLSAREKVPLKASFVGIAVYAMISINMLNAETIAGGPKVVALLPRSIYPLAVAIAMASVALFVLADRRLAARTGGGFDRAVWLLAVTNVVWFVVPNIWLPGAAAPWLGARLAFWVPVAIPFFHCAQYLGVAADRARADQPLRPIVWASTLVGLGLVLFEATAWTLHRVTVLDAAQAVLVVSSILNIHHFVIDGVMWKRPKRTAPVSAMVA